MWEVFPLPFFLMFDGMQEAKYNATAELITPSGKSLGTFNFVISKEKDRGAVQIIKLPVFIPSEVGTWQFRIYLDGTPFSRPFSIINNRALFTAPPLPTS
jgi:hypothetical protein